MISYFGTRAKCRSGRRPLPSRRRLAPAYSRGRAPLLLAPLLAAALLVALAPGSARAQGTQGQPEAQREYSRFSGTLGLLNTQPLGDLATGPGWGGAASAAWALDPAHRIRLRAEARLAGYGSEERRACLSETVGCLIEVEISTAYTTLYVGGGPELAIPLGGPELVLAATAGYANFAVSSSVRGISDPERENLLTTENFRDDLFAWSVGGDLRIPVASQFSIMLGAHYQRNGEATYVPEGGIIQNQDGSITLDERTTDANFVALTLGVAVRPFEGWTDDDDID